MEALDGPLDWVDGPAGYMLGEAGFMVGGPCDFRVSPWSKSFILPLFGNSNRRGETFIFNLGVCWDKILDLDLDKGWTKTKKIWQLSFTEGQNIFVVYHSGDFHNTQSTSTTPLKSGEYLREGQCQYTCTETGYGGCSAQLVVDWANVTENW